MKKQSGFTLIELMVVMAIIAILATAGLAAYTGYIKKARDTTRIADISAINNIALGALTVGGAAPEIADLQNAIFAANNSSMLMDPLGTTAACCGASNCTSKVKCAGSFGYYSYAKCDNGTGFAIATGFESSSNMTKYVDDILTTSAHGSNGYFEVGSCKLLDGDYASIEPGV